MELTLWRYDAVFARPIEGAAQRHDRRARLFLRIAHEGVNGFGEVAPQLESLNGDPSVGEVIDELAVMTLPQLRTVFEREGSLPSWARVNRFSGPRPSSPPAVAIVEMALLDRELRVAKTDVTSLWPVRFNTPLQTTVSLLDLDQPWAIGDEVARVRAKTRPGPVSAAALERLATLRVPVILDFNCSAHSFEDVCAQVDQVASVASIAAVEQPFPPGNLIDHAEVATRVAVPISLDEGVRTKLDLEQIARYRAAAMVCVKPARLGGLANARTVIARAGELGIACYLGGFFESGYARGVHRSLARHCVSEPSDLGIVEVLDLAPRGELEQVEGGFGVAPSREVLEIAKVVKTLE